MGHEIEIEEKINLGAGITSIKKILNCEIAAAETYREVILRLTEDSETWKLKNLLKDHEEAVNYWKAQVKTSNEHSESSSSFWSRALQPFLVRNSPTKDTNAIEGLKKGEMYEKNIYNDLLNNFTISASQKSYIKTVLIPAHETHLKHLEGMSSHAFKLSR